MFKFEYLAVLLGFFIAVATLRGGYGETSTCVAVYKEGGAPAVFKSPKCPRWNLANPASSSPSTERCQLAMLQGRRYFQEDRALCALDLRIPFPGKMGIKEVVVGVVAVFDGHNGAEASDMASKLLLEYFVLHMYFLLDSMYSSAFKKSIGRLLHSNGDGASQLVDWDQVLGHYDLDLGRVKDSVPEYSADSSHLEILKEALLRAIHDIDATFSKEASRKSLDSGTTATVILLADGQILVANIGDSKAFLCSEQIQSPAEAKATYLRLYRKERHGGAISRLRNDGKSRFISPDGLVHFSVQELTRDHHPNRDDERFRVENAGGYVLEWGGVPRVNGQLAISRAIGDVSFKRYGVISAPELTDWRPVTLNDSYLVAASDGVFEKLSLQDVCDLIWEVQGHGHAGLELSVPCTYSLADCIVNTAFEKGSMDNVAAVVVPLVSTDFSENLLKEKLNMEGDNGSPQLGFKKSLNDVTAKKIISDIVQLKLAHPVMTKFERLLVEGKHACIGCFYLSENLDEHTDYTLQVEKVNLADMVLQENRVEHEDHYVPYILPGALDHYFSGSVNLYHDNNLCFHLGMTIGGAKEQCLNPEGFASFIGFLESVPFHDGGVNNGSSEFETPNLNYVLKKRFGRGSYGEVWLAFHWHCDQGRNSSECSKRKSNESSDTVPFNSQVRNSSSFFRNGYSSPLDDKLFILKRIMVERGAATYLSGLREKYFGEVFLNASRRLGGSASARTLRSILKEPNFGFCDTIETDEFVGWSSESMNEEKVGLQGGFYEEGLNHIARFVESFESRTNEIWLAFHFEGISMSKILYTLKIVDKNATLEGADDMIHAQMLHPSKWWHWLKTTEAGREEMRSIIWQLLLALKSCHDRNITHRDIKPENMVICFKDQNTGRCLNKIPEGNTSFTTRMRIIDFGSAIDEFTVKHLYGSVGPSRAEQTSDYSPPEALLNASWHHGAISTNLKYDMWSVGVVILELIIGSPNVFQISAYTRALLNQHLEGWNDGLKDLAYKLRSLMELCILVPGDFSTHHRKTGRVGVSPASWKCSEEFFSNQIKSRDPLKLGFHNVLLLRLVRHLLQWDPEERLSVNEALEHPYFKPRPAS